MRVKPNPNKKVGDKALKVFDPVHCDYLPEEGREVPNNAYWMRRLQVQDVVEATADAKAEKTAKGGQKANSQPAKGGKKAGNTKSKAKAEEAPAEAEGDEAKAEKTEPEAPAEGDEVTTEENKE